MADTLRPVIVAPKVSVGVPVFNGAMTIARAIESLTAQTYRNLEIVISDNASTDATESVCRALAAGDPRVRYVRQPRNIGAASNFRAVLDLALGDYFLWAAADDWRSPDFIELNVSFLEAHPDFVSSVCPAAFEGQPGGARDMGDGPLTDDTGCARILGVFAGWTPQAAFYGVHRTPAIRHAMSLIDGAFASDWIVLVSLARQGKRHRCDRGQLILGDKGESRTLKVFRPLLRSPIDMLVPFYRLARSAVELTAGLPGRHRVRTVICAKLAVWSALTWIIIAQRAIMRR